MTVASALNGNARLWVIEMLVAANPDRWEPTVGCGISRDQARRELALWREDNPHDKFRLRKYAPA